MDNKFENKHLRFFPKSEKSGWVFLNIKISFKKGFVVKKTISAAKQKIETLSPKKYSIKLNFKI